MKRTDLAYIAGIVDGEGYIGISADHRKRNPDRPCWRLRVTVTNTNEWLVQYLKFAVGGGIIRLKNDRPRPCYQWELTHSKASEFLQLILPYLRLKRPQAELAILFQASMSRSTRRLTDEQIAVRQAQSLLMKTMKR